MERTGSLVALLLLIAYGAVAFGWRVWAQYRRTGDTGLRFAFRAQLDLGDAWRIGVDPGEVTPLVTAGVFRLVRNPVFSGIVLAFAGVALLVPNVLAAVAWALLAIGLEVQVRWVEEPYLRRLHGGRYMEYAAAVGRFVPGVGRLQR